MKLIYAAGAIALICLSCSRKSETETAEIPEISVAEAITDSVTLHKSYPGYISASRAIDVVGRVNGQILSKNYDSGELVQMGKVLFRIEDNTYRNRLAEAEAALQTAKSNYEYSKKHYEAIKTAFAGDAVSQMDLIQAESNYRQSEASVRNAEAQLSTARTNLGYCTVTAPITGHITSPVYNPGSYIGGEGSPVVMATIYEDDELNAVFNIEDEQYIRMLRENSAEREDLKTIPLSFSENLPHTYTANLYYMAPSIDQSTGTMKLQARLKNSYNELKPGMFVSISLPTGIDPKAILINDDAIGTDQLGKYIYVVNDSNTVVYTPIKTGELVRDSMRIVTDGVKAGDRYVTKALLKVRNGMKVKPTM